MPRPSKLLRGALAVVLLTAAVLSVETAARLTYLLREQLLELRDPVVNPDNLRPFEMADSEHPDNWLLRPGATMTLRDAIGQKRASGVESRARLLAETAKRMGIDEDEIIMRVNSRGYKGAEIDGSHAKPRILTIGDSSTFGTVIDRYSFPRSLERELERLGFDVEVVNGRVGGYLAANVLIRIDEFKGLDPEITILHMGWNALKDERERVQDLTARAFSLRALGALWARWQQRSTRPFEPGREWKSVPKVPDPKAREVRALAGYEPSFIEAVEQIVLEMVSSGSHVFVATLPGLYRLDEMPTNQALAIGELPRFTNNPFVIAKIADRYNQALRSLGTVPNVDVIDLDAWSKDAFQPRHDYFVNAAFSTEIGQQRIGEFFAEVLARSGMLEPERSISAGGGPAERP